MKPFTRQYSIRTRTIRRAGLAAFVALAGLVAYGCSGGDGINGDLENINGNGNAELEPVDGNGGPGDGGIAGVGTPGGPVCKDAVCDEGEHVFNCRDDCAAGPFLQCLMEACPESVNACGASPACGDALVCLAHCEPESDDCPAGCAANLGVEDATSFSDVTSCLRDTECIPDGPAKPDTTEPTVSCEGRCGESKVGADDCACDANCVFFGDCCEDYAAQCVEADGCGNGVCDADEDRETCPEDCKEGGGGDEHGVVACLKDACPAEVEACESDDGCLEVLACIEACAEGDGDCLFGCSQAGGFSMTAINLGMCGQEAGCFDAEPTAGPECGDGECNGDEDAVMCPEDCDDGGGGGGDVGDIVECLAEECAAEFLACTQDPACAEVIGCLATCDPSDNGCYIGCAQQGGFSNVILDFGVCAGGSGCLAAGGGGEPECGNGECEDGENPDNCPEDCDTTVVTPGGGMTDCLADQCPGEFNECIADDACLETLDCLEGCPAGDQGCLLGCAQAGGFSMAAINIGMCGQEAGCFEGGGGGPNQFCGDGDCNGDENPGNCPEDCEDMGDCMQDNCGELLQACQNTPTCTDTMACFNACDSDACAEGCVEDATEEAMALITEIRMCAMEFCGAGGGDPDDCVWQECGEEAEACLDDDACAELVECLQGCDSDACAQNCAQAAGQQAIDLYQDVAFCYQENCEDGGGPGGGDCGDGFCGQGENPNNCPEDCDETVVVGDALECILDSCGVGNQCQNSNTCFGAVACVSECDDEDCAYSCTENMNGGGQNYVNNVIIPCAFESGCIGEGGGGNPGNANAYFDCLDDACEDELETCYTNGSQTCPATFDCIEDCTDDGDPVGACVDACWEDNQGWTSGTTTNLYECSADAECHGGGGGPDPEPEPEVGCGDGECQPWENANWCPEDCDDDEPEPDCGNGDCEDGESADNCPEDCDADNGDNPADEYFSCLEEGCGDLLDTCYTNGSQTCPATFDCVKECGEAATADMDACVSECWGDNAGWNSGTTTNLYECSEDAGCHGDATVIGPPDPEPEAECGNGACEGGENAANCPADCDTGDPEVDAIIECVAGVCEDELDACYASDECVEVLECGLECDPDDFGCLIGCAGFGALGNDTIMGIFNCAQSSGCL